MKIPKKLFIVGLTVVAGVALMAGTVLARPASNQATDRLGSMLDSLVERGVISEEQAQAVLNETAPLFDDIFGDRPDHKRPPGLREPMMVVAGTAASLGMEPRELLEQLEPGQSLADYITAIGSPVDAVLADLSAQLAERLGQAIEEGRITEGQADETLADFQEQALQILENPSLPNTVGNVNKPKGDRHDDRQAPSGRQIIIGGIAGSLGLDPRGVVQQLQEGLTLTAIIEANGSTVDTVIADLPAQMSDRLNQAIENGNISQEQADETLANFQTQAFEAIQNASAPSASEDNPRPVRLSRPDRDGEPRLAREGRDGEDNGSSGRFQREQRGPAKGLRNAVQRGGLDPEKAREKIQRWQDKHAGGQRDGSQQEDGGDAQT